MKVVRKGNTYIVDGKRIELCAETVGKFFPKILEVDSFHIHPCKNEKPGRLKVYVKDGSVLTVIGPCAEHDWVSETISLHNQVLPLGVYFIRHMRKKKGE